MDLAAYLLGVITGAGVSLVGVLVVLTVLNRQRMRNEEQDAEQLAQQTLDRAEAERVPSAEKIHVIELSDWGPAFDGVNTLPRFRWVVRTAKPEARVLYLGNEPTRQAARAAAQHWLHENVGSVPIQIHDADRMGVTRG